MLLFPFFSAAQLLLTLDDQLNIVTTAVPSQSVFAVSCCFHAFLTSAFARRTHAYPVIVMVRLQMCLEKGTVTAAEAECYFS